MDETFYSALGVDSDADTETIRDAYREKVKTHHPDVSDDPDAVETFKRLTEARDVLVDATSRSQYDRVGHETYVRRYLDSTSWTVEDVDDDSRSRDPTASGRTDAADTSSGTTDSAGDAGGFGGATDRDYGEWSTGGVGAEGRGTAGNYERYNAGGAAESAGGSDSRSDFQDSWWSSDWDDWDDEEWDADADWYATADWEAEDERAGTDEWEPDATASTRGPDDPRDRARADRWATAHAAANVYSPTGRESMGPTGEGASLVESLRLALTKVGPWLAFHFAFLVSAFVTSWLLMVWMPSVTTAFVSLLLLCCTIFFSILHMISRIYS